MKNKVYCRLMAAALVSMLVAGNFDNVINVYAANDSEFQEQNPVTIKKDETVYVETDAYGKNGDVIVSDQLKNVGGLSEISDVSTLTQIENVKGEEAFSQSGEDLVWQKAENSEICYQGSAKQQLPLGVTVSYELDGKPVTVDALEGKSGHLKIRYSYENMTDSQGEYTPFLMITGMVMDNEKFTNITVGNGKLISDGERDIAIGFGIPGLTDYLDLEKTTEGGKSLEIPEEFVIEMDVTDYEAITAMTVATNQVFNEISEDDFDSIDELKDSMEELQSAADQLVDGSGQLEDGLGTLLDSSGTLKDGIRALVAGGTELSRGVSSAKDGSGSLQAGISQISSGAGDMKTQVTAGVGVLYQGAGAVVDGIAKVKDGADQLQAGIGTAAAGAADISTGITAAKEGVQGINKLAAIMQGALSQTVTDSDYQVSLSVDNSSERDAVASVLRAAGVDEDVIAQSVGQIQDKTVTGTTPVTVSMNADTSEIANYAAQIAGYGSQVEAGLGKLEAGAGQLEASLSEGGAIASGAGQIAAGLSADGELSQGAQQVQSGIGQLGGSLSDGMDTLQKGLGSLESGSNDLTGGLKRLETGAFTLSDGLGTLQNGSGALIDGVVQLSDGATELHDGMVQFNEEGIKELVNVFGGSEDTFLDKINEMLDNSREYKNFSGISEDMDGEVKFIFVTK
ncbi:MAG: hypothetical protein ACOYBL_05090 [Lachnospiraceae bacterium]|jgi:putative membrane protein